MADDKSKRGAADRRLVAAKQTYEVGHVAKRFGVSQGDVREVQKQVGPSRNKVYAELLRRSK